MIGECRWAAAEITIVRQFGIGLFQMPLAHESPYRRVGRGIGILE